MKHCSFTLLLILLAHLLPAQTAMPLLTGWKLQQQDGHYSYRPAINLLNGYAIEMHFNNGKVQQQLFFFYPDSKDYFGVGSRIYTPNDEKKK